MTRRMTQSLLLKEIADRGRLATTEEALEIGASLGGAKASTEMALKRLVRTGGLTRVRRGLYLVTTPGMPPPHPFVIASALTVDATVSGWSALHHHGLTEQIPRSIEITTSQRTLSGSPDHGRRILSFESERFEILTVDRSRMFGVEDVWIGGSRARVFERERALLDVFLRPDDFGGLETALALLEDHHGELRLEMLIAHALRLETASVAKRVGWALEQVRAPVSLQPLLDVQVKSYSLLDPSRPARGPWRSRWHLRENLGAAREAKEAPGTTEGDSDSAEGPGHRRPS